VDAAEYKLMVNFHGANKPTGEPRTYPNEMTREGILGLEYNKWSDIPPSHYATLPFTRYLAGHGDFTPCTFNPEKLKGTTVSLQLASTVVFTSPLMHWADQWKFYLASPAVDVIKQIPSVWEETWSCPAARSASWLPLPGEAATMVHRHHQRRRQNAVHPEPGLSAQDAV
jgi:alpha-glucosidase